MKDFNKLVRDNVANLLKEQGFNVRGKILESDEYKDALCSLFWQEYKDNLVAQDIAQVQVHYAEMLEVIRTLMVETKTNIKGFDFDENQAIQWYKENSPGKEKLVDARLNLLQKFNELLNCSTEAIKDQLKDMLTSFKNLVELEGIGFAQIEITRRTIYQKLGGYNKKTYLAKLSKAE